MAKAPIKRQKEFILCKGHNSPFLNCIGNKGSSEYYNSWSPFGDGKVPYCKTCCDKMIDYYLEKTGSMQSALWYTLMKLDIPFIKEVYEKLNDRATKGDKTGRKIPINLGSYINELQRSTTKKDIWDEFSATDVNIIDIDSKIQSREVKQREIDQWEIDWGKQDDIDDYRILNNDYKELTKDIEFENSQQKKLYRYICRDNLLLRKINDKRYDGSETIDTIQKRIDRTMKQLKIDDFDSTKAKSISEEALFEKIRLCNENNVKDLYKEPNLYYDFNKISKYNKDMSLRPLANMLLGNRDFNININDIEEYNLD